MSKFLSVNKNRGFGSEIIITTYKNIQSFNNKTMLIHIFKNAKMRNFAACAKFAAKMRRCAMVKCTAKMRRIAACAKYAAKTRIHATVKLLKFAAHFLISVKYLRRFCAFAAQRRKICAIRCPFAKFLKFVVYQA